MGSRLQSRPPSVEFMAASITNGIRATAVRAVAETRCSGTLEWGTDVNLRGGRPLCPSRFAAPHHARFPGDLRPCGRARPKATRYGQKKAQPWKVAL